MDTFADTDTPEDPIARIRRLRSARAEASVDDVMARVLASYVATDRDKRLEKELNRLIDAMLLAESAIGKRRVGRLREGRTLAVVGESGVGKTRALERLFHTREEFTGFGDPLSDCLLISVTAPSPCTLRLLGMSVLSALGYETDRELRENVVWDMVHRYLRMRGIRFLYIDEIHHVLQSKNPVEIGKVRDTLKGLMQDREWPVWLILSGLPSVATILGADEQVRRRTRYVPFGSLSLQRDARRVRGMIEEFGSGKAGLAVKEVADDEFVARLLHASIGRLGIVVEFIQDAIREALLAGADALVREHFAEAYEARSGCRPSENVFTTTDDWSLIDPRVALEGFVAEESDGGVEVPKPQKETDRPRRKSNRLRDRRPA